MGNRITRRNFLGMAAAAAAGGIAGCGGGESCAVGADGKLACALPQPTETPFDTVVVLMMENRSFDHLLGWLPGANGRQQGLRYEDVNGVLQDTWPLAPDVQGCTYADPGHTWQEMAVHYNGGRCDGFLKTAKAGDRFPIGYYTGADLPVLSVLAQNYTTFDNYFSAMMGATWENRLYQLTGTTQVGMDDDFYRKGGDSGGPRPCTIDQAIFDRVQAGGLTTAYYYHGEPMTGLFASRRYDAISRPIDRFFTDAARGALPNVVFVDPDYTDDAESNGTSNDYHHAGSVLVAEEFVAKVYNALKDGPQWGRMVFVLNFDEGGGFYDHVVPPACQDDTVLAGAGPFPDLKRLGFRVPCIAMGPYAPKKVEVAGPYEHCSILRMIEWRWNLPPLTTRDRTAKNLADALDFKNQRPAVAVPAYTAPAPLICPQP
jgi:phospholipase C